MTRTVGILKPILPIEEYKNQTRLQIEKNIHQIYDIVSQSKHNRHLQTVYNLMHIIISFHFSKYPELLNEPLELISEWLNIHGDDLKVSRDDYNNYKVDTNEDIKKLIIYLIENGFKFIPNYMTYLMNEHRYMIDIILKNYNNKLNYDFLVNINPKHLTSNLLMTLIDEKKLY